jgi:hypothetical protein
LPNRDVRLEVVKIIHIQPLIPAVQLLRALLVMLGNFTNVFIDHQYHIKIQRKKVEKKEGMYSSSVMMIFSAPAVNISNSLSLFVAEEKLQCE